MDAGSAFVTGLALGLSSGGHCFWTCAAVMGPYLVSTDGRGAGAAATRWSTVPAALRTLGWYNLGRLIAYLTVGLVVSWLAARGAALPVALFVSTALFTLRLALLEPLRRRVWLTHVTRVVGAVVCAYLVVSAVIMLR